MKLRVKVKDLNGKKRVLEKEQRNLEHLKIQQTHKHKVFRDRTKFYRKKKHKKKDDSWD